MLMYSMGVSVDGFVSDRQGRFDWGEPSPEQFLVHLEEVRSLGVHLLGRHLYETMQVWETDPAFREDPLNAEFADAWVALPKVVFSRTLESVDGSNARLATGTLAEEVAAARAATDQHVAIGGADLARQAVEQSLVDEVWLFRYPVLVGGGTPALPAVTSTRTWQLLSTQVFGSGVVHERYGTTGG